MRGIFWVIIGIVTACDSDSGCPRLQYCQNDKCVHKDLFPLTGFDVLGSFSVFCVSALANASGLGGGPLMTIILLVIFSFNTGQSLSLCQVTVFAGTFLAACSRIGLRHPTRDKPAIDYEFLVLTMSPLLLGTTVGVMIEQYAPPWVILALLTFLLLWITYESMIGAVKSYIIENRERKKALTVREEEEDLQVTYISSDQIAKPLKRIIESEKKIAPPLIILILVFIYIYHVLASLVRGGQSFQSLFGLDFCKSEYWIVTYVSIVISLLICALSAVFLRFRSKKKINCGYNFDEFDMIWKYRPCFIAFFSALLAGISAGLLSIGGGIVLSPIMLKLGIRPQVVVATSSVLYVLTSSLAVLLYWIGGSLDPWYSLWLAGSSLLGSLFGIVGIKALVNKFKRASIMIFAMAVMMGICAIVIPTYGIVFYDEISKQIVEDPCLGREQ